MRTREMAKKLKELGYRLDEGTNRLGVKGYMVMYGGSGVLGNSQPFSASREEVMEFIEQRTGRGILKRRDI